MEPESWRFSWEGGFVEERVFGGGLGGGCYTQSVAVKSIHGRVLLAVILSTCTQDACVRGVRRCAPLSVGAQAEGLVALIHTLVVSECARVAVHQSKMGITQERVC